jgi:hypothetical protein
VRRFLTQFEQQTPFERLKFVTETGGLVSAGLSVVRWLRTDDSFVLGLNWILGVTMSATALWALLLLWLFALLPAALFVWSLDRGLTYLGHFIDEGVSLPADVRRAIALFCGMGLAVWLMKWKRYEDWVGPVGGILIPAGAVGYGIWSAFVLDPDTMNRALVLLIRTVGWAGTALIAFVLYSMWDMHAPRTLVETCWQSDTLSPGKHVVCSIVRKGKGFQVRSGTIAADKPGRIDVTRVRDADSVETAREIAEQFKREFEEVKARLKTGPTPT